MWESSSDLEHGQKCGNWLWTWQQSLAQCHGPGPSSFTLLMAFPAQIPADLMAGERKTMVGLLEQAMEAGPVLQSHFQNCHAQSQQLSLA